MRFLLSAGEASGELYGAQLIRALRARVPDAEFFGLGGERMRAAGCELIVEAREVSVLGLVEVISSLPRIWSRFRRLVRVAERQKPDAAILIDFPDFNLRLARQLYARGIPVIYYVSPQVWAWRQGRVREIQQYVRKMLVIFPFEQPWYEQRGVRVEFVGHPLADEPRPAITRADFASRYGLDQNKRWIALLPGSRNKEVQMNLPVMLDAISPRYRSKNGSDQGGATGHEGQYLLPIAATVNRKLVSGIVLRKRAPVVLTDDARATLAHAHAAIIASGTATVEAALLGTPFVMVYRVSPVSWALGRRFVRVPFFAMPNLIAGRQVVPELVQGDFTAANVAAMLATVAGPGRERMLRELAEVRGNLESTGRGTAAERAADAVLNTISTTHSSESQD